MTGSTFIITGMPRSRTGWIANYLTHGGALCMHEGLAAHGSPEACAEWVLREAAVRPAAGISDSGAVLFQGALVRALPEARWVVIRRSVEECQTSFRVSHGKSVDLWAHKRKVDDAIMHLSPLVVDFADIDSRIHEIADYCIPAFEHDPSRLEMLKRLNVQLTDRAMNEGILAVNSSGLLAFAEPPQFTEAMNRLSALMTEVLQPVPAALEWWNQLVEVADVYDHTVDHDGVDVDKTHRVFKALTVQWPLNPFFQKFSAVLVPVMSAAISAWQYGGKAKAADVYTEVANALIFLIHGQAGVDRWMPEVRQLNAVVISDDQRKDGD